MQHSVLRFALKLRRAQREILDSLTLLYPLRGHRLPGRANDEIWYFAYGANMHDRAFRVRRSVFLQSSRPSRRGVTAPVQTAAVIQ